MHTPQDEDALLRSVALQNASSIRQARQRAEEELLRTKEALRESEHRLRSIFNQAAVGIALAGMDGRFIDSNPRFSGILGYSEAELRNITFAELTHPDDREVTIAAVRQLIAGEIPEYTQIGRAHV